MATSTIKASCYLSSVKFTCDASGAHQFNNGDLPHRLISVPAGCLAVDSNDIWINVSDYELSPRYLTAGTFRSSSCANKEVTLFFVIYN